MPPRRKPKAKPPTSLVLVPKGDAVGNPDAECLYAVLGVGRGAKQDEIRAAFRRTAKRHHPDANPGDPKAAARFRRVQFAHNVLSDPAGRAKYDTTGEASDTVANPIAEVIPLLDELLNEALTQLSNSSEDVSRIDMMGVLKESTRTARNQINERIKTAIKMIKDAGRMAKRFRRKTEGGPTSSRESWKGRSKFWNLTGTMPRRHWHDWTPCSCC